MAENHLYRIDLLLLQNGKKSRAWLSRETGIPKGTLDGWWSKDRMPTAAQLVPIAKTLGTTVEYLITGEEPGTKPLSAAQQRWMDAIDGMSDPQIDSLLTQLWALADSAERLKRMK